MAAKQVQGPTATVETIKAVGVQTMAAVTIGSDQSSGVSADLKCHSCSAVCTANYYYRADPGKRSLARTVGAITVCPGCYGEGLFPPEVSSHEFLHMDTINFPSTSTSVKAAPWTDEEILQLLEAVESQQGLLQFDWDAIALKTGRPKDQCVLQFLKLPTVETIEATDGSISLAGFPYGNVENPVMSTVAFLASMVHPKVAAAAAHAAISELSTTMVDHSVSQSNLQQIAATAIGSAAARAKELSVEEAQRLGRLRENLVDLQLAKIKIKLALFEELEKGLEEDKKDVEQQRLQLFIDRFNLRKMMLKSQQNTGSMAGPKQVSASASSGKLTQL